MVRIFFLLNIFFSFFVLSHCAQAQEKYGKELELYISDAEFDIDQKIFVTSGYAFQKSENIFLLNQIEAIKKTNDNKGFKIKSKSGTVDNKDKTICFVDGVIFLNDDLITFKSAKIDAVSENFDEIIDVNLVGKSLKIKSGSASSTKNKIIFKNNVKTTINF